MRVFLMLGAALAVAVPATAQDASKPTPEELKHADETLGIIVSALNSKDVPQNMKNGLFGCLYENPLKKLAAASTAVFAKNTQLDIKSPDQQLVVIAKICGAPLPTPPAAKPGAAAPKSKGR